MIKSVLRYPGGKSKAIKFLSQCIPSEFNEYREPLVGGGALFLYLKQTFKEVSYHINDLNYDLYCFWKFAQIDNAKLAHEVENIKNNCKDGKVLFYKYKQESNYSDFERAVRFFVMNRITFSGTVDSGGYSKQAFEKRFTNSSIERLISIENLLNGVNITHGNYKNYLLKSGDNVFIFLDPPYFSATKSRLYGKNGVLHTSFDHQRFAEDMSKCTHKWLITYDNSIEIKKLFDFAYQYEWELQYGMNNYKQGKAAKGKELLISNYKINFY